MARYVFPAGSVANATGGPLTIFAFPTATAKIPYTNLAKVDANGDVSDGIPDGKLVTSSLTGYYDQFFGPEGIAALWIGTLTGPRTYIAAPAYLDDKLIPQMRGAFPGCRRPNVSTMIWGGTVSHPFSGVGSNGTFNLADTTDGALGSVSIKCTTTGTGLQSVIGVFGGPTMDMTGAIPIVWLKVENLQNLLTLNFWIGANGLGNSYTWNLKENPASYPWIAEGQWVAITLPIGSAAVNGTPPRASFTDMEIQIYDNSAGQVVVHFGGLGFVKENPGWPNGVVSLTFDDGLMSQYTTASPYLDKYGFRATGYLITETLWNPVTFAPNYMTLAQARALEGMSGWEFGTHAYTAASHNAGYAGLSYAAQLTDMVLARNYLTGVGFKGVGQFSYPLGAWDANTRLAVDRAFFSGRTLNTVADESLPPADASKLRVFTVSNTTTLGAMTAAVDRAYANKQWLIFAMHDVVASPTTSIQMSTANFQSLIDYIKTKGIPVRTVSEVLQATSAG